MCAKAVKSSEKPKFSKETYVKWYKDMLLIRKFEDKTGQLYIQQKFGGFCHLYIGQPLAALKEKVARCTSLTKKSTLWVATVL